MTTPLQSPSRRDWGAIGLLAVTLAAGLVLGLALDRTLLRPRVREGPPIDAIAARRPPGLDRLDLTEAQRSSIDSIMALQRPRMDSVLGAMRPQLRAITDSIRDQVAAVLTPAQRAALLKLADDDDHEGAWFRDHGGHHEESEGEGGRDRDTEAGLRRDRGEPSRP
jgi:hypothetical protein